MFSHAPCSAWVIELSSPVKPAVLGTTGWQPVCKSGSDFDSLPKTVWSASCLRSPEQKSTRPLNSRLVWFVAVLLAVLHASLAITASVKKSPTFDEPTHFTAGYSYWLTNDFRLDPENGNLISRWNALPLLFSRPNLDLHANLPWQYTDVGTLSRQFLYSSGNDPGWLLLQGRAMTAIISAGLCLLVFCCSRQLFGTLGGFISELLAVFDPNLLAHGALVTSDSAAAFFFLAAIWSYWRMLHRISISTVLVCALSVAGLFLSKMSAPSFLLMAGVTAAIRIVSAKPIAITLRRVERRIVTRAGKTVTIAGSTTVIGAIVLVAIWGSFCFRFSALTESGAPRKVWDDCWEAILPDHTLFENAIAFARNHRLLPEAYLCGLAYTQKSAESRPAFLDGEWSSTGFESFFPRAFFYKTPLPVLVLVLISIAAGCVRWRSAESGRRWTTIAGDLLRLSPILTFLLVYGDLAIASRLNIGHRHLLPIYPAIFVACGACSYFFRARRSRAFVILIVLALSWSAAEAFATYPNYLSYFNRLAGGPANGYKHLVDSSLDWGQDLPALRSCLAGHNSRNGADSIYLAYFGAADPRWYGINANALPADSIDRAMAALEPGLYCVSATILQEVYAGAHGRWQQQYETVYQAGMNAMKHYQELDPKQQSELRRGLENLRFARLCAFLRHRQPIANAGHSILIFRLTDGDLRNAFYGPSPE